MRLALFILVSLTAQAAPEVSPRVASTLRPGLTQVDRGVAPGVVSCGAGVSQQDCEALRARFSDDEYHGGHNQIFFGNGPFYMSHLPLPFPPHNFQAIYEVDFPATPEGTALRERYVSRRNQGFASFGPSTSWNYPVFNCSVDRPEGQTIRGTVFQGHLERGGEPVGPATGLIVRRRIFFKNWTENPLPEDVRGRNDPRAAGEYVVFGEGEQFFAARVIDGLPGVDHIQPVPAAAVRSRVGGANHVCFSSEPDGQNMRMTQRRCADESAPAPQNNEAINVPYNDFYVETRDLEL